jgi:hypothetical protein
MFAPRAIRTEAGAAMAASAAVMMVLRSIMVIVRHCEERSDGPVSFSPRGDQNQNQNGNKLESNRDHRSCFRLLNYKPDEAIQFFGVLDCFA